MAIVLDTNALIRYFTNDIPQKAERVERLLKEERNIAIPDVVFPELEYVLKRSYSIPREKILAAYTFLLSQDNIKVSPIVRKAVAFYALSNLDIADAVIAAHSLKGTLASFDKELLTLRNVKAYWKE